MYPAQQNATDQTANFFWLLVLLTLGVLVFGGLSEAILFQRYFLFVIMKLI